MHQSGSRPIVLFVDESPWRCFDQLAAYLRRSGARPIRVTVAPVSGWFRRLVDRSLYGERVELAGPDGRRRLDELLASGRVVDVHASEGAIAVLGPGSAVVARLAACALGARGMGAAVVDKYAVGRRLADRGARVPCQLPVGDVDVDQAIDALGLPLMVKQRVATAGIGVRLASSRAEVVAALEALGGGRSALTYEQFVAGEVVHYAGVFGPDGPQHEATVVPRRSAANPLGPAVAVTTSDDAELRRIGRQLVSWLGAEGLVAVELIRDADGCSWPIDLGPRVWGNVLAPVRDGAALFEHYGKLIGLAPAGSPVRTARSGRTHVVQPRGLLQAVAVGRPNDIAAAGWDLTGGYGRLLGLRYVAIVWFEALAAWRTRRRPAPGQARAARPAGVIE